MSSKHSSAALSILLSMIAVPCIASESRSEDTHRNDLEVIKVSGNRLVQSTSATGLKLSVKETPQSISSIDLGMIEDFQIDSIGQALNFTTSISSRKDVSGSATMFYARGFRLNSYMHNGISNVGSVAQQNRLDSAINQNVEVIRGANGILQGAGEASASINLITKRPDDVFALKTSALVGSWNNKRLDVDVTTPLSDDGSLSSRFVLAYQDKDSEIHGFNTKTDVIYGIVEKKFNDNTSVSVSYHSNNNDEQGVPIGLPYYFDDGVLAVESFDQTSSIAPSFSTSDFSYEAFQINLSHQLSDDWFIKATAQHIDSDYTQAGPYTEGFPSKDGFGLMGTHSQSLNTSKATNLDLRAQGDIRFLDVVHQVVLSASYADSDESILGYSQDGQTPLGSIFGNDIWKDLSFELPYGSKGLRSSKHIAATLAVRSEWTESLSTVLGYKANDYSLESQEVQMMMGEVFENPSKKDVSDRGNPYIGLVLDISDNVTTYASITDIFNPQPNSLGKDLRPLEPVVGTNYEAGIKSEFFDDRFSATFAIFKIEQEGLATMDFTVEPHPALGPYFIGYDTKTNGFELEVNGFITDEWQVNAGFSKWNTENDASEDLFLERPRKQFKLQNRYDLSQIVDGLNIGLALDWKGSKQFTSTYHPLDFNIESHDSKAQTSIDLFLNYDITDNWAAKLAVNNVTDKKFVKEHRWETFSFNTGREIKLRITYQF